MAPAAGADVGLGSIASIARCPRGVRFTPNNGHLSADLTPLDISRSRKASPGRRTHRRRGRPRGSGGRINKTARLPRAELLTRFRCRPHLTSTIQLGLLEQAISLPEPGPIDGEK